MPYATSGNNADAQPVGDHALGNAARAYAPRFAMTVDVEDYFQVWAFSDVVAQSSWDGFERRVAASTRRCLDMFDEAGVKATFFTLGWVGEREPALIRDIVARGHELASHGFDHSKVGALSRTAFADDVARAKALLEDIAGVEVAGYRAPGFSISAETPWAYEVLAGCGYRYSSSAHPIAHDHYGDAQGARSPYRTLAERSFVEAPVATIDVAGRRFSCAGGGWFRAMPLGLTKLMLERAAETLDGPAIFYVHPWEVDPDQPRIDAARAKSRFRHYLNLRQNPEKLRRLLSADRWGRLDEALAGAGLL